MATVFYRKQIGSYCVQYRAGLKPDGSYKVKTKKLDREQMSDKDLLYVKLHYDQVEKECARNVMLTFNQLIEGWKDKNGRHVTGYLDYCKSSQAPATCQQKRCLLDKNILPVFGNVAIDSIDFSMLNQYRIDRQMKAADRTVDIETHHIIFPALHYASALDLISMDQIPKMKRLISSQKRSTRPRALEKHEVKILLEQVEDNPVYHTIFFILLHTGMRPGELVGDKLGEPLRWQDIDLENKSIHIGDRVNWRPKTRQRRTIPISKVLLAYLLQVKEKYPYAIYLTRGLKYCTMMCACKKIFRKCGFSVDAGDPMRVTLNTLRHTFATQMLLCGTSPAKVSKILGHSIKDTTELYAHILDEHVQGATDCLDW